MEPLCSAHCPFLLASKEEDKGSDVGLGRFPHLTGACGSGGGTAGTASWSSLVMLLPERRHHGVVTKRKGYPGPCR